MCVACGTNRFLKYCQLSDCPCIPVLESTLCGFLSSPVDVGLKHSTIKTLAGVHYLQIKVGFPDFFKHALLLCLDYIMKGIQRHQVKTRAKGQNPLTINPTLLQKLKGVREKMGNPTPCIGGYSVDGSGEATTASFLSIYISQQLCMVRYS